MAKKYEKIGNTEYKDIPDKQYAKVSAEKAQSFAKIFEQMGVPFSAMIKGDKATITLSGKDMEQFRAALDAPEKKSILGQLKENKTKASQQSHHKVQVKSKGEER